MKRRDGVCIETEPAFPQAGSVKDLYKQRTESSTEKEMWENLKCSFQIAVMCTDIYVCQTMR